MIRRDDPADSRQNKKRRPNKDGEDRPKTPEDQEDPLENATTLYVGNLYVIRRNSKARRLRHDRSFYTTEEQIHELFAKQDTHQFTAVNSLPLQMR